MTASSIHRARRRATALVAVLAVCSTLAACGADASAKAAERQRRPILTQKSVVEVWKHYDKLNNAALVRSGPPSYDTRAFDAVDTGPVLDSDMTYTAVDKIDHTKQSKPFRTIPRALYAPVEGAGFALSTTLASDDSKGALLDLESIVRTGDPATWKMEMSVEVQRPKDLPGPLGAGQDSTASKADVERARKVVTSISEYWRTLRKPAGIVLGLARNPDFVKSHRDARRSTYDVSSELLVEGIPRTPGAGEALRVVRAQGGLLVLATVRLRGRLVSHEDGITIIRHGVAGKLFGTRPVKRSGLHFSAGLAISVPDEGRSTVLGALSTTLLK